MVDKRDICFIHARQRGGDYICEGVEASGYRVVIPYKDYNLLLRCLREAWFRLHLPHRELWFNSELKEIGAKTLIVSDPLIVRELLFWLRERHPRSRIILAYENRVSKTLAPEEIKSWVDELWTYDPEDSERYGMRLDKPFYLDVYRLREHREPVWDILSVSRDKGRGEELLQLEKRLRELGLKTCFRICPDRSFQRYKKIYYKPFLPYQDYLGLLVRSRSILNIMPAGQTGITQREMEAVFDGVKCITTNRGIRKFKLYDPSRYFILGEERLEDISQFLDRPFRPIAEEELWEFRFETRLKRMLEADGGKLS